MESRRAMRHLTREFDSTGRLAFGVVSGWAVESVGPVRAEGGAGLAEAAIGREVRNAAAA